MDTTRLAPLAGTAGSLLVFAGLLSANDAIHASRASDAPSTIATDFATNADGVRGGVSLALVGLSLLFWFLGDLRSRLPGSLASVAFAGGVVALAGITTYVALLVAASGESIGAHPDAAATLRLLGWEYGGVLAPAFAALVGASSLAVLRHRLLHPALGTVAWLGLPLAAALAFAGFLGGALVVSSLLWLAALAAAFSVQPGLHSAHGAVRARRARVPGSS